jgi:hypothetical protein
MEAFTAKGPVFAQLREVLCSKAATWCTPAFAHGAPATLFREKLAGNIALVQSFCGEDYSFLSSTGGAGTPVLW